ncbi:MAG: Dabb family protein [Streptosporangiaceae bacterium]
MIRHMALFTLRDGVSADDPRVDRACAAEVALMARFPDVDWTFGVNNTGRPDAADFAGTGDFPSNASLRAFLADPMHHEAGQLWGEIARWTVADIDVT